MSSVERIILLCPHLGKSTIRGINICMYKRTYVLYVYNIHTNHAHTLVQMFYTCKCLRHTIKRYTHVHAKAHANELRFV